MSQCVSSMPNSSSRSVWPASNERREMGNQCSKRQQKERGGEKKEEGPIDAGIWILRLDVALRRSLIPRRHSTTRTTPECRDDGGSKPKQNRGQRPTPLHPPCLSFCLRVRVERMLSFRSLSSLAYPSGSASTRSS